MASGEGEGEREDRMRVYVAWMGEKAYATAAPRKKTLRNPVRVELPVEQKFGKARRADKLGARSAHSRR